MVIAVGNPAPYRRDRRIHSGPFRQPWQLQLAFRENPFLILSLIVGSEYRDQATAHSFTSARFPGPYLRYSGAEGRQAPLGCSMVNQCANPNCGKPLHYLREGRIFVFDLPDPDVPVPAPGGRARRLQHFWLCGPCAEAMVMEQTSETEIRLAMKTRKLETGTANILPGSLAL